MRELRPREELVQVPVDDLVADQKRDHAAEGEERTEREPPACAPAAPCRAIRPMPTRAPARNPIRSAGRDRPAEVEAHQRGQLHVAHPHPARIGERDERTGRPRRQPRRSPARGSCRGRRSASERQRRRSRPASRIVFGISRRSRSTSVIAISTATKTSAAARRPRRSGGQVLGALEMDDRRRREERGRSPARRADSASRSARRRPGSGRAAAARRGAGRCRARRSGRRTGTSRAAGDERLSARHPMSDDGDEAADQRIRTGTRIWLRRRSRWAGAADDIRPGRASGA